MPDSRSRSSRPARTLGGRARRVPWDTADGRRVALDNGQHILIGAYRHTLDLLQRVGVDVVDAFERTPLHLVGTDGLRLKASRHAAPWHLLAMIVTAKGLGFDDRWSIATSMLRAKRIGWTLDADCTVAHLFEAWRQPRRLIHRVWEPLCVAALNTPIDVASAQVFLNVLRDSLGASARDPDLLLPRVDLGGLLPDAAERLLTRSTSGSTVRIAAAHPEPSRRRCRRLARRGHRDRSRTGAALRRGGHRDTAR